MVTPLTVSVVDVAPLIGVHPAPVLLDNFVADEKTQAEPAGPGGLLAADPVETVENVLLVFGANPVAPVFDRNYRFAGLSSVNFDFHGYRALFGAVLESVGNQVMEDLFQPVAISLADGPNFPGLER